MTVVQTPYILLPYDAGVLYAAYTALSAITGTGDKFAVIFQAPATGSLTDVAFQTGAVTTGGAVDTRLETVDGTSGGSTGNPTGTLAGTNTNVSITLTAGTDSNSYKTGTLTSAYSATVGDYLALVMVNPALGNWQVRKNNGGYATGLPFSDRQVGGTWTKTTNPIGAAVKIGGTWYPLAPQGGMVQGSGTTVQNINTGTTPDEQGNVFTPNFPYRVVGFYGNFTSANVAFDVILYSGTTNVLSRTVDPTIKQASGTFQHHFFTSSYTLTPGTTYRIICKPTTASNVGLDYELYGTGLLGASAGLGLWQYTSRTDAGAWSDTTDKLAQIGLICDGINVQQINRSYFG